MNEVRLGVDVGGTFTDLVALGDGQLISLKVPSTPGDQSEGVLAAIRAAGTVTASAFAHGMTVATNALLERAGARTALVTTEGFRDVIEIARQNRPALYDLTAARPPALIPRELRFTVRERMGPAGVVTALDEASVGAVVEQVRAAGVEAVAVCLLFSFLHPEHEQRVEAALRHGLGEGVHVSLSSQVLPEMREYERFSTTVADAYLAPGLGSYLRRLAARASAAGLPEPAVMQSSGGTVDLETAAGLASGCALSGPAGGVVGAAWVGRRSGYEQLLSLDMGGTSTDVAPIVDGEARMRTDCEIAGVPIRHPSVDVHTVSAGGGSIAWADAGGALRVGPRSAGAEPGPAAYGRGGREPTVTDANLVLGLLGDEAPLGGGLRLDRALAHAALARVGERLGLDPVAVARGTVRVAEAEMARALRVVSVQRGLDPREFALCAFGGAGGLHACALADELSMQTILIPRACGVLSALGLALADQRRDLSAPLPGRLDELDPGALEETFARLEEQAREALGEPALERRADLRYRGQAYELTVAADDRATLAERFAAAHAERYGYRADDPVELVTLRLVATVAAPQPEPAEGPPRGDALVEHRELLLGAEPVSVEVLDRERMGAGSTVTGPALVHFAEATCFVAAGWSGEIDPVGTLVLQKRCRRSGVASGPRPSPVSLDPVTRSVMASALAGIAEEMGAVLIRGARSSNIKERRDCSAALFDAQGRMVAQAEHIPVHLGAMPEAVAAIIARGPVAGDVWAINDPFAGGTHLPDITLVAPLTHEAAICGYAVTRAHHADVGGKSPGSMPSDSCSIFEEGLVIPPVRLVRGGEADEDLLGLLLANVRTPEQRRGDLRAQLAAGSVAQERLNELIARRGVEVVWAAFADVLAYTERRTRERLAALPDGRATARSEIEGDGLSDEDVAICATVEIAQDGLTVDFAGTAGAVAGNVNCPIAVTRSACLFALRVLLDDDVPANAGTFAALSVRAPAGSLVDARRPSAVVAGNVETSQRLADTVLAALRELVPGLPAAGQGTMNNLVLGGAGWVSYETIGGGQGAGPAADGPSGVHVGMSNTQNTPIEALELELPLRVERYELREGSGGAGAYRGGDGIVRAVRVLESATLSLLSDRRRHEPLGVAGGRPGACGVNTLDGGALGPKAQRELAAGQVVTVETPGGGGYGAP